jgi:hypothetical protein
LEAFLKLRFLGGLFVNKKGDTQWTHWGITTGHGVPWTR